MKKKHASFLRSCAQYVLITALMILLPICAIYRSIINSDIYRMTLGNSAVLLLIIMMSIIFYYRNRNRPLDAVEREAALYIVIACFLGIVVVGSQFSNMSSYDFNVLDIYRGPERAIYNLGLLTTGEMCFGLLLFNLSTLLHHYSAKEKRKNDTL